MGRDSPDPTVIESVAITAEDVVAAVEARYQRDEPVVLRVTPPFSGRMRARLHIASDPGVDEHDAVGQGGAVHLDPRTLLTEDAPSYPRPADTEDALRADPSAAYSVERHRARHEQAVADWRDAVRDHFAETVTFDTADGTHRVDVSILA